MEKRILQLAVILLLIMKPSTVSGLYCYQCSSEAIFTEYNLNIDHPVIEDYKDNVLSSLLDQESCESFASAYSWGAFIIQCKDDELCGKTTTGYGQSVIRGCVLRNSSSGNIHPVGCGVMMSPMMGPSDFLLGDQFCTCDSNYCNAANHPPSLRLPQWALAAISLTFNELYSMVLK